MIKKCIFCFLVLAFLHLIVASDLTSARSHKARNRVKAPKVSQIGFPPVLPPPQIPIFRPPITLPPVDSGGGGDNDTLRNVGIGIGAAAAIGGIIYLIKKIKSSKKSKYPLKGVDEQDKHGKLSGMFKNTVITPSGYDVAFKW